MLPFILFSCTESVSENNRESSSGKPDSGEFFEGVITLTGTFSYFGSLFEDETTYYISENRLKRERKSTPLGGEPVGRYAGMIVDLEKDRVTLYLVIDYEDKYLKHSMSIAEYQTYLNSEVQPSLIPSPFDKTFTILDEYILIHQVEDSTTIEGFRADFSQFNNSSGRFKQEVFDTKNLRIKRPLLENTFPNLPDEINFPLGTVFRTTLTDVKNDSIIAGRESKGFERLIKDLVTNDSSASKTSDLDKIARNKWVNRGLKFLKKGVDLSINTTIRLKEIVARELTEETLELPAKPFKNAEDLAEFVNLFLEYTADEDDDDDDHDVDLDDVWDVLDALT